MVTAHQPNTAAPHLTRIQAEAGEESSSFKYEIKQDLIIREEAMG